MGYNTTLVILNDALHEIRDDKEFGRKVYDATLSVGRIGPTDISSGYHANAATVIESHHADYIRLIAIGGNCGQDLGLVGTYRSTPEDMLRALAEKFGYTLRKKPGVCLDCYAQRHLDTGKRNKCAKCGGSGQK